MLCHKNLTILEGYRILIFLNDQEFKNSLIVQFVINIEWTGVQKFLIGLEYRNSEIVQNIWNIRFRKDQNVKSVIWSSEHSWFTLLPEILFKINLQAMACTNMSLLLMIFRQNCLAFCKLLALYVHRLSKSNSSANSKCSD